MKFKIRQLLVLLLMAPFFMGAQCSQEEIMATIENMEYKLQPIYNAQMLKCQSFYNPSDSNTCAEKIIMDIKRNGCMDGILIFDESFKEELGKCISRYNTLSCFADYKIRNAMFKRVVEVSGEKILPFWIKREKVYDYICLEKYVIFGVQCHEDYAISSINEIKEEVEALIIENLDDLYSD
jgi:hypothetical protein